MTNHSPLAATTVVQLYYQQQCAPGGPASCAAVIRYYSQLVRYERVHVAASATRTVKIPLKVADMAYWDNNEEGVLGKKGWQLGRAGKRAS